MEQIESIWGGERDTLQANFSKAIGHSSFFFLCFVLRGMLFVIIEPRNRWENLWGMRAIGFRLNDAVLRNDATDKKHSECRMEAFPVVRPFFRFAMLWVVGFFLMKIVAWCFKVFRDINDAEITVEIYKKSLQFYINMVP